jgi:hypothetical protein
MSIACNGCRSLGTDKTGDVHPPRVIRAGAPELGSAWIGAGGAMGLGLSMRSAFHIAGVPARRRTRSRQSLRGPMQIADPQDDGSRHGVVFEFLYGHANAAAARSRALYGSHGRRKFGRSAGRVSEECAGACPASRKTTRPRGKAASRLIPPLKPSMLQRSKTLSSACGYMNPHLRHCTNPRVAPAVVEYTTAIATGRGSCV